MADQQPPQTNPEQPPQAPSAASQGTGPSPAVPSKPPVVILVIGMAGSGKTTLIQRLHSHLHSQNQPPYIINMDPAVTHVPYSANIDIRDTVKYKQVMKQYNLGPNGGILTSCNLFATRFDQVLGLLEKPRDPPLRHVLLDTPGQIEIFTWSASGQIVTELLASSFPTIVAFVVDTPRCAAPQTFMSNMLQAVSILYKTRLPMLLVFNKVDVMRHDFAVEWMEDFDTYHEALEKDATYAATLSRSLSLVLDEFYKNLRTVGVSALTGEGMTEFFQAVDQCATEYHETYIPELEARKREKEARELRAQQKEMEKVRKDLAAAQLGTSAAGGNGVGGDGAGGSKAGGTRQSGAVRSSQVISSSGGEALAAAAMQGLTGPGASASRNSAPAPSGHRDTEEGSDDGSYELSDDSIEDQETGHSLESRAK